VQAAATGAPLVATATAELPLLPPPDAPAPATATDTATAVRIALRLHEGDDPGTYLRTHVLAPWGPRLPYEAVLDVAAQLGSAVYPPEASGAPGAVARRAQARQAWVRWLQVRHDPSPFNTALNAPPCCASL